MNRTLSFAALWFGMACGESLSPEDIPDIDGTWTLAESIESSTASCNFLGTLDIVQDGETFTAQFSRTSQCATSGVLGVAAVQSGSIASGRVGLETVDFRIGDCDYRGVLASGERPAQVTGSILCTMISTSGTLSTVTGHWHGDRVTE